MKALVLFSGGVDSTTCLAMAIEKYGRDEVLALSVGYGQKHSKELDAAQSIASFYGVSHRTLDLSVLFEGSDCSLLKGSGKEIPKESYAEQLAETGGSPVSQRTLPCVSGKHRAVMRMLGDLLRRAQG